MTIKTQNTIIIISTLRVYSVYMKLFKGPSWSYGSWIYNYTCKLWVRIPPRQGVLDTTLCDNVCQWLAPFRWFSQGTSLSATYKTDRHDITEILLKVALNTITLNPEVYWMFFGDFTLGLYSYIDRMFTLLYLCLAILQKSE